MNQDGKLDIALTAAKPSGVTLMLNQGGGKFPMAGWPTAGAESGYDSLTTIDLDKDGLPEVVTICRLADFTPQIEFLGNTGGALVPFDTFTPTRNARPLILNWITSGDLDRDGNQDLIMSATLPSPNGGTTLLEGYLIELYGTSNGLQFAPVNYRLPGSGGIVAIGDMDADGKNDIVSTGPYIGLGADGNSTGILFGQGVSNYRQPRLDIPSGVRPFFLALGDYNRDGRPDIAVTNPTDKGAGTFQLLLNLGNGQFPTMDAPVYVTGLGSTVIATGDLNGDGRPDLVTGSVGNSAAKVAPSLIVYLNTTPP